MSPTSFLSFLTLPSTRSARCDIVAGACRHLLPRFSLYHPMLITGWCSHCRNGMLGCFRVLFSPHIGYDRNGNFKNLCPSIVISGGGQGPPQCPSWARLRFHSCHVCLTGLMWNLFLFVGGDTLCKYSCWMSPFCCLSYQIPQRQHVVFLKAKNISLIFLGKLPEKFRLSFHLYIIMFFYARLPPFRKLPVPADVNIWRGRWERTLELGPAAPAF